MYVHASTTGHNHATMRPSGYHYCGRSLKVCVVVTCAVVGNTRQVSLRVERDRLVAGVVARHVAFATVDAHVLTARRDNNSYTRNYYYYHTR